jgi:hypothetical protein
MNGPAKLCKTGTRVIVGKGLLAASHAPPSIYFCGHIPTSPRSFRGRNPHDLQPEGLPAGKVWRKGGPRENPHVDEDLVIEIVTR